jgi:L-fuculose-phosphate aldolase
VSKLDHKALRKQLVATARAMNARGLNQGTSGNLSVRVPEGLLITPTSLPYDRMEPEDIVAMDMAGGHRGRHRPSSEWRFHRDILARREDVDAVLHCHATYATTLAIHERGIPAFHYMVAVAGGPDIRCTRYATFGTQALSDAVLEAMEGRTACLMAHHGLVVGAKTLDKALWLAIEVETLAKMYVHALAIGEPPWLSEAEMARVAEQMRRMSYGQAPDLEETERSA